MGTPWGCPTQLPSRTGGEDERCVYVWKQARSWDLFFQAGGGERGGGRDEGGQAGECARKRSRSVSAGRLPPRWAGLGWAVSRDRETALLPGTSAAPQLGLCPRPVWGCVVSNLLLGIAGTHRLEDTAGPVSPSVCVHRGVHPPCVCRHLSFTCVCTLCAT